VLFSLNRIVSSKFPGSTSLGPVDLGSSKVATPTTLLVKYHQPFAVLPEMLASVYFTMVPRDFDPKNPDGTGPFKYQSFTPGVSSTFLRNPNYWHSGLPHLDSVVTTNIADETSQVNALQSNQVDVVDFLVTGFGGGVGRPAGCTSTSPRPAAGAHSPCAPIRSRSTTCGCVRRSG